VGKNTLNSVALELLSNLLDNIGDIVVCGSFSDDALGGLETVPCGENNVSLGASDWLVTDNNSGGGVRSIAIEVGSANDLGNVAFSENDTLVHEGREMAHDMVD